MVGLTALSSKSGRPISTFLNFYVSPCSTVQRGFKYYIYFLYIIRCCFQQWKNFQNRLAVDKVIARSLMPLFFKHSVYW